MRRLSLNTSLVISLAAIGLAAVVVAVQLPALLSAVFTPRLGEDESVSLIVQYLAAHEADLETYRQRFNGRSVFFTPRPWPRPAIVVDRAPVRPEVIDDAPPPLPRSYTGPDILFVLGDQVWFQDGLTLNVGDEGQGVRVIASNPPWTVRLAYAGSEYDVVLFERTSPGLESAPAPPRPTPGIVLVDPPTDEPMDSPDGAPKSSRDQSERQ